ncbi:PREDICTED: NADH dehydrogenase [ubiquinone] 1 alpha subcomplex subunit 7-like [Wasmannia auropunctata]|uniref:NADH dehydrogenase [ubiquinone] 1 alpha subcomplex subunit 7-like n=1 Tax=Wasmannia auropunctata TaxID=64793 RepID=UPI0005EEF494|nr:PREDICTED: NADH dehydrogenase [ubiquinone] 1 alpha subcomplex subunit 7-like [Wasmannia auropunctata]
MPGPIDHRSVSPLIKLIRDISRGREVVLNNRWVDEQAKRTQPPPEIPGGPYDRTSQIYYYPRDARREVKPPMLIMGSKQIGTEKESATETKYITPGKTYNWSS